MIVGIPKETFPGEKRVAVIPATLTALGKAGIKVRLQSGAGVEAGFPDALYQEKGAEIVATRADLFAGSECVLTVRSGGANPEAGRADLQLLRRGQTLIGMLEPLSVPAPIKDLAATGATVFAMELMPRITRAQSMDVLSSMASIAGYKAVLLAASTLPRMFPMMMTAAGTLTPARVLVMGAGVAGLQAIASARRLGAVVEAYDVRAAVKEQVLSMGAKFLDLGLDTGDAEDKGGYARAMGEDFYKKQQEALAEAVSHFDVVITTAAVPGKRAPVLVTKDAVRRMAPGSVIVDLAAERGGNCEYTRAGETVVEHGVSILGPLNLPATVPYHASQMYAKNMSTFLLHLVKDGALQLNMEDEITRETLVARDGDVALGRIRELLGLPALAPAAGGK
jgi:NAD(P) transhydrogenase subunit alpha